MVCVVNFVPFQIKRVRTLLAHTENCHHKLQNDEGSMIEEDTMCLLDFYVHESMQRRGIGLELFQLALKVGVCLCNWRPR